MPRRLVVAAALGCLLAFGSVAFASARDFENPASHDTAQQFSVNNVQRQDTPNDPKYDFAEPDDPDSTLAMPPGTVTPSTNLFDEDFGFFGFPSQRTRSTAIYATGPNAGQPQISGFNAGGAWKLERGRPDTTIAILDTGIKWDRSELRLQIHLNKGELPYPNHNLATPLDPSIMPAGKTCQGLLTGFASGTYDANGDGVFNVADYNCDDRVSVTEAGRHGASGQLNAEDLIFAFGHCKIDSSTHQIDSSVGCPAGQHYDNDGNGFANDIAGWDFFDNDNNPYDASSYFAAGNHGSGRATDAAAQGNNGNGGLGVCPHCQLMPIRVWDTFVTDGNTFGMGILYATDNGAKVIEGANGSTYHSAFAEQASNYAYRQGVAQTFSGDDLNTGNHNYAANYGHVQLIQGTVPDTIGLGMDAGSQFAQEEAGLCTSHPPAPPTGCPGTSLPVGTYFRGANTTQYGGKSSISMEGTTGSENTGKASGAAALVISAAKDANPSITLRPDETREILEQTAEPVLTGNTSGTGTPDPGANPTDAHADQWTTHFGWGRVNLGAAVSLANSGKIPPEASINTPDWYAPVTGSTIDVTGLAQARFATGGQFHWELQWGVGETPTSGGPTSWTTAHSGDSTTPVTDFGTVDLNAVRSALASYVPPPDSGGPTLSTAGQNPYKNEFTLRLTVTGTGISTPGIDRRVLTSVQDTSLRTGFPKRLGTGGEAPINYADINGDNVQELIVPTEDGMIHAYEPDGSELPGWPVHTQLERPAQGHDTAPGFSALAGTPPREPPRGAVVADLSGNGQREVITTAGNHVYAWEPDGSLRPGFPVSSDLSFCNPADESQPLHHPKCGFLASPAVGHLKGPNQPLDIVAPSLDGHLYAFNGDGNLLNGFPVQLADPTKAPASQMIAESINQPTIGDLNGDGKDDVVVASNEAYGPDGPSPMSPCPASGTATDVLAAAAGGSSRLYAISGADGGIMPGWPVHMNGAIQSTLPLIGPGQDASIATIPGQGKTIVASTTGSASINEYSPTGTLMRCVQQGTYGGGSDATDRSGTINLFESASLGKLLPSDPSPDIVKYGLTVADVANLALTGQNVPYNHLIGAYNSQTGAALPAFPRITDDFQFLSASNIAKVDPTLPDNQVVAGTGLGLLHAYDGTLGVDAPGFPKVTGGWLFAPAGLSPSHPGSNDGRIADITREGYLFEWNQPVPSCQTEWPAFRHDPQLTGNYDKDGTPPSTPTGLSVTGNQFTFVAPGNDFQCGTATAYQIATSDSPITPTNFAAATQLTAPPPPTPQPDGTTQTYTLPAHQRYVAIRAIDGAGNIGWPANLDTATQHTLIVLRAGTGSGTVTSSPAGINCGATCSHAYVDGTHVTLTATPDSGSTFAGWSGAGCSGAATCPLAISSDVPVTATFTAGGGGGGGGGGATGSGGAGGSGQGANKLRLKVRRKHRHARHRSCFKVTVTDQNGAPLSDSTVSLAVKAKTKTKLTGATGKLTICRGLQKHGGQISASKPGYGTVALKLRHR